MNVELDLVVVAEFWALVCVLCFDDKVSVIQYWVIQKLMIQIVLQ